MAYVNTLSLNLVHQFLGAVYWRDILVDAQNLAMNIVDSDNCL